MGYAHTDTHALTQTARARQSSRQVRVTRSRSCAYSTQRSNERRVHSILRPHQAPQRVSGVTVHGTTTPRVGVPGRHPGRTQSLPSISSSESRRTLPSSKAEFAVAEEQRSRIIIMDADVVGGDVVGQVAASGLPGAEDLSEGSSPPVQPSLRRHIFSCRRPPKGGITPELFEVGGEEDPGLDGGCATAEG